MNQFLIAVFGCCIPLAVAQTGDLSHPFITDMKEHTHKWKPINQGYWYYAKKLQPDRSKFSQFYSDITWYYYWTNKNTTNVDNNGNVLSSRLVYMAKATKFYVVYFLYSPINQNSTCIDFYFEPTNVGDFKSLTPLKTICTSAMTWNITEFECGNICRHSNSTFSGVLMIRSRISTKDGDSLIAISCVSSKDKGNYKCPLPKNPHQTATSKVLVTTNMSKKSINPTKSSIFDLVSQAESNVPEFITFIVIALLVLPLNSF